MKREALENLRWVAPVVIATAAATPAFFFVGGTDPVQDKLAKYALPLVGLLVGACYTGLEMRSNRWKAELATHVGVIIQDRLMQMLPEDLDVTESERRELRSREVIKTISGIFWETVDADEQLKAHKEFFYTNGAIYSTSIDAYILLPVIGFCYLMLCFVGYGMVHLAFSAVCISLALLARYKVLPVRRQIHVELVQEQMDLIARLHRQDVEDRFREIVVKWRRERGNY